jgi:4a-hydroxytetrahydrobiopterin dehydratase
VKRPPRLDDALVALWLKSHTNWTVSDGHLVFEHPVRYEVGCALATASVPVAEELDHHPFLTVGYNHLRIELWTHDKNGLTQLDLTFAEFVDSFLSTRH